MTFKIGDLVYLACILPDKKGDTNLCPNEIEIYKYVHNKQMIIIKVIENDYYTITCKLLKSKMYPNKIMTKINSFDLKYRFLSNFYPSVIWVEGISYPTVEHAYQAMKTLDTSLRIEISKLESPGRAKRAGRILLLRKDWEEIKISVMKDLLYQKFTKYPELKIMLINTEDSILIEGNYWNDTFWGICGGKGKNHLGILLMDIRNEFK